MINTKAEIVQIVDENNNEIGGCPRQEMREKHLIHRASYILVLNHRGHLFVQKRTQSKDIYPGYYDIAAGGVVLAGESYEKSAQRELAEELGVSADLTYHFDQYYADGDNKVWGRIFSCIHEGPFVLQKEEIESGEFKSFDVVYSEVQEKDYTPDGIIILNKLHETGWEKS